MEGRHKGSQSAVALDIFDRFCAANTLKSISILFANLCSALNLEPTNFPQFFPKLKENLTSQDARELLLKYETISCQKGYERGTACQNSRVLIIGAGPCGLRTAIEAQLLGAKVVLIEKRDRFSRNNVLHLWPSVITDLKKLGAKKFYGKFCAGSIDHISINQIQCILLKVALLVGVEFHDEVGFEKLLEPQGNCSWKASTFPEDHPVSNYEFDVLIGADGRRNTLDGFKRKALRAKLAIAITANFLNKHTQAEAKVQEISGVSYIFKQSFFQDMCEATAIDLENIVYYKDETHYFVMTAKKHSLLYRKVLIEDYMDTDKLLAPENINMKALREYALEAANFSTEYQLPNLEFALNHYGQPDVAIIDFTAMYTSENACRVMQRNGHKLLLGLVGDSLLEPFWPTGSGCARGFLSSLDACWMIRNWAKGRRTPLEVIAERESVYRLLGQTTHENLNKDHSSYTVDPHTRYPNLNVHIVKSFQIKYLYDTDGSGDFDQEEIEIMNETIENRNKLQRLASIKNQERDNTTAEDTDHLAKWIKLQVLSYGVIVDEIQDVFVGGDALCALLHRFRPDLIPEFPLPPEVEDGIEAQDAPAFRNQLAFDFFNEHYGLSYVVSGFDSIQLMSSHMPRLVSYLFKVYDLFKEESEKPKVILRKKNIKTSSVSQSHRKKVTDGSLESHSTHRKRDTITNTNGTVESQKSKICNGGENGKYYQPENSSGIPASQRQHPAQGNVLRSATLPTFLFGQQSQAGIAEKPKKSKVYPSSIQKLVKKLDSGGYPMKANETSEEEEEETLDNYPRIPKFPVSRMNSFREKRMEDAEKAKFEAIKILEAFKLRKAECQKEERASQRESIIRTVRKLECTHTKSEEPENFRHSTVVNDDFFNEYNMKHYRLTVPSIGERSKNLESKLNSTTGLKMKTTLNGFIQSDPKEELEKQNEIKVGKIEKDDWIVKLLESKIAENSKDTPTRSTTPGLRIPVWCKETVNEKGEPVVCRRGVGRSASARIAPSKPMFPFARPERRSPERIQQNRRSFQLTTPTDENIPLFPLPNKDFSKINNSIQKTAMRLGLKTTKSTPHVSQTPAAKSIGKPAFIKPPREKSPDIDDRIFDEIDDREMNHLLDWTERNF